MKILFAVQGTGNGHVSRAMVIYPLLAKYGEVDVLISGIQADLEFPYPVRYRKYGLSFIFGRHGGVDIWTTLKKLRPGRLIRDIRSIPVADYDLVINDFEPVSAWACLLRKKKCIALSHQSAVLHARAPKPRQGGWFSRQILRYYAPSSDTIGFHFQAFSDDIYTPVIRKDVRETTQEDLGHYTVYLPAYDDNTLLSHLSVFTNVSWQVFSKHNHQAFRLGNIQVYPVDNQAFFRSMVTARGILCGAGFETPAEALFLGKKLMVIPMKRQYEQQCNAAALAGMGVPVIPKLCEKYHDRIRAWIDSKASIHVSYADQTEAIVERLIRDHAPGQPVPAFAGVAGREHPDR